MKKLILMPLFILFTIDSLIGDMASRYLRQEKTIMISGEQVSKEVVNKALARIKEWMERQCFWGDYEKNQEIRLRIIYTFANTLGNKGLFVLVENKRREIWPFEIIGDTPKWDEGFFFLDKNNKTVVYDENNKQIGRKFFEKDAFQATIKIEGTYTIPPMKVTTELQKKEVECVKEFVKKLIKEKRWEGKFPDGQVYLWMTITEDENEEDIDYEPIVNMLIENCKDWGFVADLKLNKERTKCEFDNMSFSEKTEYHAPDTIAEKRKTFYHKEILKIGLEI